MAQRIYLDHHATTPVDPRVLDRMLPFFSERFGNAASEDHAWGWTAAEAVDAARQEVALLINASADEIIFTSGATESSNLALLGLARANPDRRHLVTSAIEHISILAAARQLQQDGYAVTWLPVDRDGCVRPEAVERALRPDTLLVSVQTANNEVGTLQAIPEIGRICLEHEILFHTDASQAAAWIPIDVQAAEVDLLSLSAHKMHGPKGIGALFIRGRSPRIALQALACGGGQEYGLRPGTLNVPAIVGFGEACRLARQERESDARRIRALRDDLWERLREADDPELNGHPRRRLPNNLHVSFRGHDAERLIRALPTLALSTGSACASGRREPSHVLQAMGRDLPAIHASVRFGLGRFTTPAEIEQAAERLKSVLARHGGLIHAY